MFLCDFALRFLRYQLFRGCFCVAGFFWHVRDADKNVNQPLSLVDLSDEPPEHRQEAVEVP